MTEAVFNRSKLIVASFVSAIGLVVLVPNLWPLVAYWRADRAEAVTARWVGSNVATSSRDTVGVPAYAFERRVGPVVQECWVDLVKYRHAPGGKPVFETLSVVPGETCADIVVLDDPPNERWPLVGLGLLVSLGGLALLVLSRRRKTA